MVGHDVVLESICPAELFRIFRKYKTGPVDLEGPRESDSAANPLKTWSRPRPKNGPKRPEAEIGKAVTLGANEGTLSESAALAAGFLVGPENCLRNWSAGLRPRANVTARRPPSIWRGPRCSNSSGGASVFKFGGCQRGV